MSWIAVAIGGSALISGIAGASASRSAASAQERSANQATAEQRRQFDTILGLQQPAMVTGTGALNTIARLYGLPYQEYSAPGSSSSGSSGGRQLSGKEVLKFLQQGMSVEDISKIGALGAGVNSKRLNRITQQVGADGVARLMQGTSGAGGADEPAGVITPTGPDMSAFTESPDYQFNRTEGLAAVDRTAAARSGALSGNAVRGAEEFASNLASREYGNFFNRLAAVAGIGQNATNTTSQAASSTSSNISSLLTSNGDARASGIMGAANGITDALNTGLNGYMLYRGGYFNKPAAVGA